MSELKQFTFYVRNDSTREIATFIGQGTTIEESFKDAMAGVTGKFRPDSNGGGTVLPLNIRLPEGTFVSRKKTDFEGDRPFRPMDAGKSAVVTVGPDEDCPI